MLPLIGKYQSDIEGYWHGYLKAARKKISDKFDVRLNEVKDITPGIKQILDQLGKAYLQEVGVPLAADNIEAIYKHGILFGVKALKSAGVSDVPKTMLPEDWRAVDWLETRNLTALEGITDDINRAIVHEVSEGMLNGETVSQIADRLAQIDGLAEGRAYRIAHYESMLASNQGTILRYYQMGVQKVEWIACGDDHVCPECDDLDGKIFDIEVVPPCPLHVGCRCTVAPVVGTDYEPEFRLKLKQKGFETFLDLIHHNIMIVRPELSHA